MPAPALSPVVINEVGAAGFVSPPVPALFIYQSTLPKRWSNHTHEQTYFGLPCDVPPVLLLTGPLTCVMRLDWMTSRADICWPTP